MRKIGLLAAGVAALGMALGQANVIKIATQSPLSGPQAALGEQIKLGAELAIEEAKAKFKALGFDLVLVPYDDQANPDVGVANANRIINDPDILGVVGHLNSGVAIPSSEVYARVNLVMVSPANTNPRVT
ncbi:MAG: ABC transporter substrate-binding protein, partial [Thermus sp.]